MHFNSLFSVTFTNKHNTPLTIPQSHIQTSNQINLEESKLTKYELPSAYKYGGLIAGQQLVQMKNLKKIQPAAQILTFLLLAVAAQNVCEPNCLECSSNNCRACDTGYQLDIFGKCTSNLVDNCQLYGPGGVCFVCKPTFALQSNKCVKMTDGCLVEDTGLCTRCGPGQSLTGSACLGVLNCQGEGQTQCQACRTDYTLLANRCVDSSAGCAEVSQTNGICLKCKTGYFKSGYKCFEDKYADPRCYVLDTKESCLICKDGFNPEKGKCLLAKQLTGILTSVTTIPGPAVIPPTLPPTAPITLPAGICPTGSYTKPDGSCAKLSDGCVEINPSTQVCIRCDVGYELAGGFCNVLQILNCQVYDPVKPNVCLICSERFYPSGSLCKTVSTLCNTYNPQTGACFSCVNPGFNLVNGVCVDPNCLNSNGDTCLQCKPNFVFNIATKSCLFQDPNCANIIPTACLQCSPNFYLSASGLCRALPANCQQASSDGNCQACLAGFTNKAGVCQKDQPVAITIPNCLNVDVANKVCLACANRFYTSGNSCQAVSQLCETYNPQNGKCLTCKSGSTLNNGGNCIENQPQSVTIDTTVTNPDPNCLKFSQGTCQQCSNRYYVSVSNNKCVPVNPGCRTYSSDGNCTSCFQGYSVNAGLCVVALNTDPNCKNSADSGCLECYVGYFYSSADKICKRLNPLCRTSNLVTGACLTCYQGYKVNNLSGNCEIFFQDPNCPEFKDNLCVRCLDRYYLKSGACAAVNPLCKDYSAADGACQSCYPGYSIQGRQCVVGGSSDSNCLSFDANNKCISCSVGFYNSNGVCAQVSPLCKGHNPSNGFCLNCYPGYELTANGKCEISQTKDQNCKTFSPPNSQNCIECYPGFIPKGGRCQEQNPLCATINKSNGDCLSCYSGYILSLGNCVQQTQASAGGLTVSGAISDVYCVKASNGVCVTCAKGYYYNKDNKICVQVDSSCNTYNNSTGDCLTCYTGYVLVGGKCGTVAAVQIANCANVNPQNRCTACIQGYYLKDNVCNVVSLTCATYDRNTGACTSCNFGNYLQNGECIYAALFDANCLRYNSATYCEQCKPGYTLTTSYTCL